MLKAASRYSYVGIFFGVAIAMGFGAGNWLDGRYKTAPYLTIFGLLIGVAAGFKELYRVSRQALKDEQRR
jgi:ATP synthase protein I